MEKLVLNAATIVCSRDVNVNCQICRHHGKLVYLDVYSHLEGF